MTAEQAKAELVEKLASEIRHEQAMKLAELETDFKDGCENDRYYLLELLEKFMDVAELADETATKVIFRGQIGLLAGAGAAPEGEKK